MYGVPPQNVRSTPLQTLAVTGLAECLKRRSLKKILKIRALKSKTNF